VVNIILADVGPLILLAAICIFGGIAVLRP
jgi:hypothetical protein